ncbi:MAG: hypothetical protein NTY02_02575 [Acidobacteria bacterium]|nr:hypothetical protein [Acidobacteriota bacterium]
MVMDESVHPGSADTSDDGAFEALLWELFLRFVDMPGDRVDQAIRDAQRRLCEALDLDRATLWQIAPDDETDLRVSHVFERGGTVEHIDERTGSIESGESRLFLLDGADPFPATGSARLMFPWLAPSTVFLRRPLTMRRTCAGQRPAQPSSCR